MKLKFIFLGIISSIILSCWNDLEFQKETQTISSTDYYLNIGKKLKNPYSVKNMKIALANIHGKIGSTTSKVGEDFSIESTY